MDLKKTGMAGTSDSGDIQVTVEPNPGHGIRIDLISSVQVPFGVAIEKTVYEVLEAFQVENAYVTLRDRGALDCVIRARMQCALCRGGEITYDWSKEDVR